MRGVRSLKSVASSLQTPNACNLDLFFAVVSTHQLYTWKLSLFYRCGFQASALCVESRSVLSLWFPRISSIRGNYVCFIAVVSRHRLYAWNLSLFFAVVSRHRLYAWNLSLFFAVVSTHSPLLIKKSQMKKEFSIDYWIPFVFYNLNRFLSA